MRQALEQLRAEQQRTLRAETALQAQQHAQLAPLAVQQPIQQQPLAAPAVAAGDLLLNGGIDLEEWLEEPPLLPATDVLDQF